MNDVEYGDLARVVLTRLFLLGIPAGFLAALIWYRGGGSTFWGYVLLGIAKVAVFWTEVGFDGHELKYAVELELGGSSFLGFPVNQVNLTVIECATLFAAWRHASLKAALRLAAWTLAILLLYQTFSFFIQCYIVEIGPDFANRQHIMWEPPSWYPVAKKIASFDKFLLRFWAGFPIFGSAIALNHFVRRSKKRKKT